MSKSYGHVLVQHSAYGYKQDFQFKYGLESRELKTKADLNAVTKAGGVVLPSYQEAEKRAYDEMYPADNESLLTPKAKGTFVPLKIDGLAVYVPRQ